jgi:hypothetical protein
MLRYTFFLSLICMTVGYVSAMQELVTTNEENSACGKSAKWPMFALQQTNLPKDVQGVILKQYIDVTSDNKMHTKIKLLNDPERLKKYNAAKINIADVMWLGPEDKRKLLEKVSSLDVELYQDEIDGSVGAMLCNNKEAVSLPLWLRCKLGIKYSKSIKSPIQALKQTDLPKELQDQILRLYIENFNVYHIKSDLFGNGPAQYLDSNKLDTKTKVQLCNDSRGFFKFKVEDLMWLDPQDKEKLILIEEAIKYKDEPNYLSDPSCNIIVRTYDKVLTEEEYNKIISVPLRLRRKLDGLFLRNVGVFAGQYDLRAREKEILFERSVLGGSVGFGLYGLATMFGVSQFSLIAALLSYVVGAGSSGAELRYSMMKEKSINPPKPWVKEKRLCPEDISLFDKSYWQLPSNMIQLRCRE